MTQHVGWVEPGAGGDDAPPRWVRTACAMPSCTFARTTTSGDVDQVEQLHAQSAHDGWLPSFLRQTEEQMFPELARQRLRRSFVDAARQQVAVYASPEPTQLTADQQLRMAALRAAVNSPGRDMYRPPRAVLADAKAYLEWLKGAPAAPTDPGHEVRR